MDHESERVKLRKNLLELQYQKQLLGEEQEKLISEGKNLEEYAEYLLRMQWTNYRQELEKEHQIKKEIWFDRNKQINLNLENITLQIDKISLDIFKLESLFEIELKQSIDYKYEPERERVKNSPKENHQKVKRKNKSKQQEQSEATHTEDALNIPKRISCLIGDNEELESWLVDFRIIWYRNSSDKLLMRMKFLLHVRVWIKTWIAFFGFKAKSCLTTISHRFKPLHKPRLPK